MYGKEDLFDAERVVDLLEALETFTTASSSAQGDMGRLLPAPGRPRYTAIISPLPNPINIPF